MKLLKKSLGKDDKGFVEVAIEEDEDLWHAFNLIREGDYVTATTYRKVSKDTGNATQTEKIKLRLTVEIEAVDYDSEGGSIRLKGRNRAESEHVKLGAYHTLELQNQSTFELFKSCWDVLDLERVQQACDPAASADLAAVLITEGLAHVCLVGSTCTLIRSKIEVKLPRKRGPSIAGYDDAWRKFLTQVFNAVVKHVDFNVVRCLVIAGPGFAKDAFKAHLEQEAVRQYIKPLIQNRSRLVVAHASSAYKQALEEALASPGVSALVQDTKALAETRALKEFLDMMGKDPSRAFYGPAHVFEAHKLGAVQTLLLADSLFRVKNTAERLRFSALVEDVRLAGGQALVFSTMHASGQQLALLSGIAAILRFPLPELEDLELCYDLEATIRGNPN